MANTGNSTVSNANNIVWDQWWSGLDDISVLAEGVAIRAVTTLNVRNPKP